MPKDYSTPSLTTLILGLGGLAAVVYFTRKGDAEAEGGDDDGGGGAPPVGVKPPVATPPADPSTLPPDTVPASTKFCMASDLPESDIWNVQAALRDLKFLPSNADGSSPVDGNCGTNTKKSISAYRAARGLFPGEFVNARMYALLKAEVPCRFTTVHWLVRPELWGLFSLASTPGAYVIVNPKKTPFGSYEAAVVVKKDASSGTAANGDLCPYGVVTEVLGTNNGYGVKVGDFGAKRIPTLSAGGAVTWTEQPWDLVE